MTCDMEDRHIVAIDLGSSKIALSVAHINGDDIEVIYYKEMPSQGITKSRILTVSRVNEALKPLVEDAEKELSIKITQVVVGMPKYWVRQVTAKALIKDRNADECITEEEIEALKTSAFDTYPLDDNNKECIFGAVAQSFSNGEEFQLLENEIIGMPSERAKPLAKDTPTSREPMRPGPLVKATALSSSLLTPARFNASWTTGTMFC